MTPRTPPANPWTRPAKFSVAVAAWCFLCAAFDWVSGQGWWAVGLGAGAVANVWVAARLVRTNVRWQQDHQRRQEAYRGQ